MRSLREAVGLTLGDPAGLAITVLSVVGVVVGTYIDPVAGAIASAALLVALVAVFVFALRQRALYTGPYRVLEETITWEFVDPGGKEAKLIKKQKVRFNYLTITLLELASGDGDLFADFSCNYGTRVKDGQIPNADENGVLSVANEKALLILMTPEHGRDDEADLESRRIVRDGFTEAGPWITHRSAVSSKRTEFMVIFPADYKVKNVRIAGSSGSGSRAARGGELREEGSRQILRLRPRRRRAGQSMRITWSW